MSELIPFSFSGFLFKQLFAIGIQAFANTVKLSIVSEELFPSVFKELNESEELLSA
jgi:hypothetical protein